MNVYKKILLVAILILTANLVNAQYNLLLELGGGTNYIKRNTYKGRNSSKAIFGLGGAGGKIPVYWQFKIELWNQQHPDTLMQHHFVGGFELGWRPLAAKCITRFQPFVYGSWLLNGAASDEVRYDAINGFKFKNVYSIGIGLENYVSRKTAVVVALRQDFFDGGAGSDFSVSAGLRFAIGF